MSVYVNDWKDTGEAGMLKDFGIDKSYIAGAEILFASYTYENYEGDAFVLFRRDGNLYEVNGSHCSCYGLSECDYLGDNRTQWRPEETTIEALLHRLQNGEYGFYGIRDELMLLLDEMRAQNDR
jgi:hypothetical protein